MENSTSFISFAVFVLLVNSFTLCMCATNLNYTTDKHALGSFKASILSDPRSILSTNWSENTSVCNWIGVTCGIKHHRVTSLNISSFDLTGIVAPHLGNLSFLRYLDISFNNFTGFLPFEISKLRRLKVMSVGVNSFSGEIPAWLGSLPQLKQLFFSNNTFSGTIPEEIGNISSIQILYLSNNELSGSIPRAIFNLSSMREVRIANNRLSGWLPSDMCNNMPNIETLSLTRNELEGQLPPNIWKCKNLEVLTLSVNNISGNIPSEIGRLSMLREFSLQFNQFLGVLPEELGNLSRLELFYIDKASLTGKIPSSIFNISSLRGLSFSSNNLTGTFPTLHYLPQLIELNLQDNKLTGGLPKEIGTLPNLQNFYVFGNSLSGSIPPSLFNISSLKRLQLSFNQFSGTLPSDLGNSLFNLEVFLLSSNKLSGPIPSSIVNASKLAILEMSNNSFTGFIPDFGNLRLLERLFIWGNNLSGAASPSHELTFLSSLTNCPYLMILQIENNPLNGILPASIGKFSSLVSFRASECNIMGHIPSEIGNLSSLLSLYLFGNGELSGPIPPTIGKLKQLQRLYLHRNRLVGSIPIDLCGMNNLGVLAFDRNMLVGPIPECLGDVESLREIYLDSNQLNSTIPPKLWTLTDLVYLNLSSNYFTGQLSSQLGNLKTVNSLDLSFNKFSGNIPTSIDGCQSLATLNLSNNFLAGPIPKSLGNVEVLTELDLSSNNLSGSIPNSLEDLNILVYLNVSNNKLEGQIPNGGCFGNFTAQSFSHNLALCGSIRFGVPPCSKDDGGSRKVVRLIKYMVPSLIFLVIALIVILFIRRRNQKNVPTPTDISPLMQWRRISYIELERGTSCFSESNLLGRGSFGSVFEATLSDELKVAVKVFNLQMQRAVRSFDTEAEILSAIRHRNLVQLIGCCSNTEFKALILTYMPNGSLDNWLHSTNYCLDLIQRLKVAIDIAAALEYLHHSYTTFPVVHCDVKPSNVLLDEDMVAHLADFGIAKLFERGEAFIQTQTLATIGYAAPEYGMEGKVSTDGDVYSFGIMLLEMLTGKKPTDEMFDEEMSIKQWVSEALQQNAATEILALTLLSRDDQHFSAKKQCVLSIFELAMKCSAASVDERINMTEAAATLRKIRATIEAATEKRRRPRRALSVSIRDH